MRVRFKPDNPVIRLCMEGLSHSDNGDEKEALQVFELALKTATDDYERFIASYHLSHQQKTVEERLELLKSALEYAKTIDDDDVRSAYPTLYREIASCYQELGDLEESESHKKMGDAFKGEPKDQGPFYHGTRAKLDVGDFLTPGGESNYRSDLRMSHIYFTAGISGAVLAAALAKGDGPELVYQVEPTGEFENDPNVTDKKFPGNLTRSYRSRQPLRIVDVVEDWRRLSEEERKKWLVDLKKNKGEIID